MNTKFKHVKTKFTRLEVQYTSILPDGPYKLIAVSLAIGDKILVVNKDHKYHGNELTIKGFSCDYMIFVEEFSYPTRLNPKDIRPISIL